jgi:hypothetical protein
MKRFPEVFDKTEGAILSALYETSDGAYSSYTLAQVIYPDVPPSTQEALDAFIETRAGTERLIVRGFVNGGERYKGADGVYFNKIRLTPKGQKAAIQHRSTASQGKMSESERKSAEDAIAKLKDAQ